MLIDEYQLAATAKRYEERQATRDRNLRLIRAGKALSVDEPKRVERFLARHGFQAREVAGLMALPGAAGHEEAFALERVLGSNDLMGVCYLERGLRAARSVCRISIVRGGAVIGYGTGFLVSPRLVLTNHHVLGDHALARGSFVELEYEIDLDGGIRPVTVFQADPDALHLEDQHLDYALVAIQPTSTNGRRLSEFPFLRLIADDAKAIAAQWVNIIQHPNGEPKQLSLRENQVVDLLDEFMHYEADTAPGSSGSPVFNDLWEVVALHHSGVVARNAAGQILSVDDQVWRPEMGEHRVKWIANEGVRISRIVAHLQAQNLDAPGRRLLDEALAATPPAPPERTSRQTTSPEAPRTPDRAASCSAEVGPDGTATWTIPLTVSVRLCGQAPKPVAAPAPAAATPASVASGGDTSGETPEGVLAAARREIGVREDVLGVRLGYRFRDGWITKERALVVSVRQRLTPAELRERRVSELPRTFRGLPVDITNPTLAELIGAARGPAMAEAAFAQLAVPMEEILYRPPAGVALAKVTDDMRVFAHVSPDQGWPNLRSFLEGTKKSLVIGMYDFGAPHIVASVEGLAQESFERLALVMQKGESTGTGTKADDLRDQEVVDRLDSAFGDKFETAWVKKGPVNGWIASSYHIKVAVRDESSFWVSSGNWQSSNQPDADPLNEEPQDRKWLSKYNREWHAIVEHAELAKTYEAFLLHDLKENQKLQAEEDLALPDLLVPGVLFVPTADERAAAFHYFKPFDDTRRFTVTPILSPDNYFDEVLALLESAEEELLIQNQTFNAPREDHEKLHALLSAVLDKQRSGVRVRVIFRVLRASDARHTLEGLQDFGLDLGDIRVQKNCHTKGIVVDRKRVLLGSQNWSNDGVSVNRDASLLFDDEPLARYFADIFDHDWKNLAQRNIGHESMPTEVASAERDTPPDAVRLTWKDYMEMMA